ncbi:MAG: LysM peptidoglycan-binding domain-containing protein [Lachnospiraceae bacterium]|nr:LysM peptidoglycan-binding domain-containing protein [Lachnospiraceae bacterium]
MKKAKSRHIGSRLLSILLALVLVLTNFGGMFPGKAKADGESNEGKFAVSTKGIINHNKDESGATEDVESDAVITAGAGYYKAGDKVTLTVDGTYEALPYLIDRVFYNDGTADHEITKDDDGNYSFTMPEGNVTVTAHVIEFTEWTHSDYPPTRGNYYLSSGVTVDLVDPADPLAVHTGNLNLHLHGNTMEILTEDVNKQCFFINQDRTLSLFDDETSDPSKGGRIVFNGTAGVEGTLNMYGGTICYSGTSSNWEFDVRGELHLINGTIDLNGNILTFAKRGRGYLLGGRVINTFIDADTSNFVLSGTIPENAKIHIPSTGTIDIAEKLPTDAKYVIFINDVNCAFTNGLKGHGDASNFISYMPQYYEVVLNDEGEAVMINKRAEISVQANLAGREWTDADKFTFTLAKADDPKKVIDEVTIGKDSENHAASFKISIEDEGEYSYVISQKIKGQTIDKLTYDAEEKNVTISAERDIYGFVYTTSGSTLTPTVTFTNTYGYQVTTKGIINQKLAGGIKDVESDTVITAGAGLYESGQTVTLTINNAYKSLPRCLIDRVFYNDGTADHEITKNADGEYSFTMPESNVTVTAHVIEFEGWGSQGSLPHAGNYFLGGDVKAYEKEITDYTNLLLYGHSVTIMKYKDELLSISENATLSLYDGETGASTTGGQLTIERITELCGTINMYGGTLSINLAHAEIDGGRFNLFNGTIDLNGMFLNANEKGSINLVGGCVKEGVIRADNSVITLSGTTFEDASIDLKGTGIINIAGKLPTGAEYKVSADKVPCVLTKGLKGNGDASNFIPADSNYVVCLNADSEAVLDYDRTKYKLYVGGIQVTEGNCNKSSNHWSYDFENHVLTLDNYEFVGQGYAYDMRNGGKKGAVIYYEGEEDLTIKLVGENVITPDGTDSGDCGILSVNANATLNFTGDGSLLIDSVGGTKFYKASIKAEGSVVINCSGALHVGNDDIDYGVISEKGTITIETGVKEIEARGWYGGFSGTVINKVVGTGYGQWLARLEVNETGATLNYKKVTFPVAGYKLVFDPGYPNCTSTMPEQDVMEGDSFEFPECGFDPPNDATAFVRWEMTGVDEICMPGGRVIIANNCALAGIITVTARWVDITDPTYVMQSEGMELEFNGQSQKLVTKGTAVGGTVNYALSANNRTAPTTGWQETIPEATFAGTYYVWCMIKGDSLHFDSEAKCLVTTIKAVELTASVGDQSAEYNGSEHKGSSAVTFTGLLDGHTAEIDYTPASGMLVGVYTGMFDKDSLKVVDADGNNMTNGYVLKSATPGKMTVTNRAKKYQINVTTDTFVGPYDGEEHTVSGYNKEYTVDGNTYTVEGITSSGASLTFVGIANVVLSGTPVVRDAAGNDVTDQFDVSLRAGYVGIVKRDLEFEITSESKSFDYDGQEHFYNKYQVYIHGYPSPQIGKEGTTEFEMNDIDFLRITPTASGVTNVGSYSENNTFTWQIDHADQFNITVTCNYGTISVDPLKVTIAASDAKKTYDGTALTKDGFGTSGLKTGDTHEFSVTMTADSKITDCGTQANVIGTVDGVAVTTGVETAVGNYLITTVDGKLSIDPAPLTITAQSKELTYNGTAQGWSGYDVVGLFGADAITAVTSGTITFPSEGSVANKIDSYEFTSGKAGNYSVTKVDGVLTMKKASNAITITAASDEWTYDGKAHSNASVTVTSGTLFDGDTLVAEADGGPVTTVADSSLGNNPVAEGYKIMHGDEDVTANYVITCKSGTLSVKPKKVTITAKDASKEYDGSELTEGGFTTSALEDGDVHEFTVEMTADSTVTGVGTQENVIATVDGVAVMTGVETMVGNYFVTTADGLLEVTASTKGLVITSSTKSWTYDGMNHVDNSYVVTYDGEEVAADATGRVFTLSTGDVVTIYPSAAGVKNVGDYSGNNIFMYSLDNAANYTNVSVICGTLSIEPKKVTIEADTAVKEYDGTPLTSSGFIMTALEDGDTHEFTVVMTDDSTITDYGGQANVIETVDGVAVATGVETPVGNYLITTVDGELFIDPASVTITAQSREFTYDGKAHDWSGYFVEGLVGSDAITAVTSGTITFPSEGSVANKIDSYEFTTGSACNYIVMTVDGELTMANASKAIAITAADGEWTYDGKAHTNASVTVTSGTLFDGDELVATAGGSVTNVRDNKPGNNPVAEYKIMHGTEDVTASYMVTCVAGTLTLTTTPVVITAQSKDLVYDGTAQGWAGYDVEGLIGTDAITAVTSGTITFPSEGTVANKIASYEFTSGDALNYTVRTVDGALTMANAAREITITAASDAWTYDGTAHGNGGVTVTGGRLFPGDALVASANGSVKGVADTMQGNNLVAAGYKIMHGTQDVTASYVVTCVAGTLTVNPKALYVTADEKTRFHGHADPELTYVVTGLVEGDKISGELTRESGEATGQYKILQGSLSAGDNYTIIFTGATFAIMPNVLYTQSLAEQLWNVIAAGGKQTVYWSEGDSLPFNIMKILQDHPQITLVFSYSYKGVNYRVAIPGSAAKAYPNIPWYGPLYLYGNYGMYNEDGSIKDGAVNPGVPGGIVDGTLRTYVIRRGDTLSRIARRLGTTVRRLVDLNHIKNPNRIYAGHELIYEAQE